MTDLKQESHANTIHPKEQQTRDFLKRIRKRLEQNVSNLGTTPMVYLGSGGDLFSSDIISDSNVQILVNNLPFLGGVDKKTGTRFVYEDIDKVKQKAQGTKMDYYSFRNAPFLEPGIEALHYVYRESQDPSQVKIEEKNGIIEIKWRRPYQAEDKTVYYIDKRIEHSNDLSETLSGLGIQVTDSGLLVKAGAGDSLFTIISELNKTQKLPKYFVMDPPTAYPRSDETRTEAFDRFSEVFIKGFELFGIADERAEWGYETGMENAKSFAAVGIRKTSSQVVRRNPLM